MKLTFESKPVCGEDVKYIKAKNKNICRQRNHEFSQQENAQRKSPM